MRLDAHQHFWKYSPADYAWISDKMQVLQRDFLPLDLKPLLVAQNLDGSIAVQAQQTCEETRWLLDLAERNEFIRGVVGWVDLCVPRIREQVDALPNRRKLVGIRHIVQDEPDDAFMLRPDFRRGIAELSGLGLVYDLLLHPRHLPVAVKLVREFPNQAFVLDHIAKPPIADRRLEPWAENIRALASFSNVSCKLSGMVTEARWKEWRPDDFKPYLDTVLEAFGPGRLMIGSDWPVCLLSSTYPDTLGIVLDYVDKLSADEQQGILGSNCARVYGIA